MNLNERRFREGQWIVFNELTTRIMEGKRMTSVILHPRGGKSDVQRMVTLWAVDAGICCAGISINMNVLLRNQMGDVDRINANPPRSTRMDEALSRYEVSDLRTSSPLRYTGYKVWPEPPMANGEFFASFTIQTLMAKAGHDGIIQWTESKVASGKPPLFFFDECQMLGGGQPWGRLYHELHDMGAYVVSMTGTAHRSDGEMIPGFSEETLSVEEIERVVVESDPDPEFIQVVEMEGVRRRFALRGDIEVGLKYGWNPPPGQDQSLCNLSRRTFDFDVTVEENGGAVYSGRISQAPQRFVRKAISKAVRQPQIIAAGVELLVRELDLLRQADPRIKAIVFTGNDKSEDETNAHAREVEREIRRIRPDWTCLVATSADDESAADRIAAFDRGQDTVLVVKQSAGVGLDAPTIKVGLDLSTFRQFGVCVQRALRVATPFEDQFHAIWITPADAIWDQIWHEAVVLNQGEMARSEMEEIGRRRQKRREAEGDDVFVDIGAATPGDIYDSYGNSTEIANLEGVDHLIRALPDLLSKRTYVEIINRLTDAGLQISAIASGQPVQSEHSGAGLELAKKEIDKRMRRIAWGFLKKQGYADDQIREKIGQNQTRYGEYLASLWVRVKETVGLDPSIEFGRITNVEQIQAIDEETKRIEREVREPASQVTQIAS